MSADSEDRSAATRALLLLGTLTGPVFFGVAVVQALARPGYHVLTNAISQLSLGDLGWIQITSFLVTGCFAIAAAIGVRRKLTGQKAGAWGALLVGTFGLGLIVAGIFPPDPSYGFPPGAPDGPAPMPPSGHASLHALGFFLSMLSLIANCFVFLRRFRATGERGWAVYSVTSAVATIVLIGLSMPAQSVGGVIVALAGAAAFAWVSFTTAHLRAQ